MKVRIENVQTPEIYIGPMLERVKEDYIKQTYKISAWESPEEFLEKLARRSGRLLKVCFFFKAHVCLGLYLIISFM